MRFSPPIRACAVVVFAFAVGAPSARAGVVRLVSKNNAGVVGNGRSQCPGITPSGSFIAFESSASNLVPGDTNGEDDIFVRNMRLGTIERVSVSTSGAQGDKRSWSANLNKTRGTAISDDGNRILFTSTAENFGSGPVLVGSHVWLRDRAAGTTVAVDAPVPTTNFPRGEAVALSGDGNHAIFIVTNGAGPIHLEWYVRDLRTGNARLLWNLPAPDNGYDATISADGRWIVLQYQHVPLAPPTLSTESNLRLFDRDPDGDGIYDEPGAMTEHDITAVTQGESYVAPKLSANGRWLTYSEYTLATLGLSLIHRLDRDTDVDGVFDEPGSVSDTIVGNYTIIPNGVGTAITNDGRWMTSKTLVQNTIEHYFRLHDLQSGTFETVNFSNTLCAPDTSGGSTQVVGLSDRALSVVWDTGANDLDPADTGTGVDVYVWDRLGQYPCDCLGVGTIGTGAPNSFSPLGASLGYSGSRNIAQNDLVIRLANCPPAQPGRIIYGPATTSVPFGNGHLYVAGGTTGIVYLASFAALANGTASIPVDNTLFQASVLPFAAGTTVYFQAMFADPLGGGARVNTSNALRMQFCP